MRSIRVATINGIDKMSDAELLKLQERARLITGPP